MRAVGRAPAGYAAQDHPLGLTVADRDQAAVLGLDPVAPAGSEQDALLSSLGPAGTDIRIVGQPPQLRDRPEGPVPLVHGEPAQLPIDLVIPPRADRGGQADPRPVRPVQQSDKLRHVGHASLPRVADSIIHHRALAQSRICLAGESALRLNCTGASGPRWPDPMGYGVIGSPTGSGPVSLGSSPGTPATLL